jgi:hypothetical protein
MAFTWFALAPKAAVSKKVMRHANDLYAQGLATLKIRILNAHVVGSR